MEWLGEDLYSEIRNRTKQKEGSASSPNIKDPVSLVNLQDGWEEDIAETRLQGSSATGAYFDSRGFLTTGHGSLISKNRPGSPSHKMDIVKWINKHKDILNVSAKSSESLTSLYNKVRSIDKNQAEALLDDDLREHVTQAKILAEDKLKKSYDDLSNNEKKVIVDMTFNLGAKKYSKFTKFWKALDERNFEDAAFEIQDSDYYDQVGDRAVENIDMIGNAAEESEQPSVEESVQEEIPMESPESKEATNVPMERPAAQVKEEKIEPFEMSASASKESGLKYLKGQL